METSLNVVSNRLPISLERREGEWELEPGSGGLVQAMRPLLEERGGRWIGWPGTTEPPSSGWPERVEAYQRQQPFDLVTVAQSEREHRGFYAGFANRVLWPLFHGLSDRCAFRGEYWETYRQMNEKFAEAVSSVHEPGDVTWVHDYHLTLVPRYLSGEIEADSVGFFLHIPFPEPDQFRRLPWSGELLEGMLGYDLLGFQSRRDLENFARTVERATDASVDQFVRKVRIDRADRRVVAKVFPIGCDFGTFADRARSDEAEKVVDALEEDYRSRALLLGVDRLDYTKGLLERLEAFELLLERHPEWIGEVILYQLVVPSRECVPEYRQLRQRIERAVGRIQGRFATSTWQPIQYRYTSLEMDTLTALYRYADAAVVTPVRDGMNLVSKEYCASQVGEPGALILSELAGAAEQLGDGAVLVHPHDTEAVAAAMYRVLEMPRDERSWRMRRLRESIERTDVYWWAEQFRQALSRRASDVAVPRTGAVRPSGRGRAGL